MSKGKSVRMVSSSQKPGSKSAPMVNYAIGSGSRPNGGKIVIESSAPKNAKLHRG